MRTLRALPLFLIAACSGSGSGPDTSPPPAQVLLDTTATPRSETTAPIIEGMLLNVVLEEAGGSFSTNLLAEPTTLRITDHDVDSDGFALEPIPAGTWIAAHLVFVPGSLTVTLETGEVRDVVMPQPQLDVPFATPVRAPLPGGWLVLRHTGVVNLLPTPDGDVLWTPEMEGMIQDLQPLFDTIVEIVEVDVADQTATAIVPDWNNASVGLRFSIATELSIDGDPIGRNGFLDALAPGSTVLIHEGLLQAMDRLWVLEATLLRNGGRLAMAGRKNDVSGVITDIRRGSFTMRVRHVHKAGFGFPSRPPFRLRVDTDSDTKIKWVPRLGRHTGHLPFGSLSVGMRVDVEWFDAPVQGTVLAHKVDIRGLGRGMRTGVTGTVDRVDVTGGRIAITTDGGRQIVATVDPDSTLLRHTRSGPVLISLDEINVGAAIWLLLEPDGSGGLRVAIALLGR